MRKIRSCLGGFREVYESPEEMRSLIQAAAMERRRRRDKEARESRLIEIGEADLEAIADSANGGGE